MVDVGCGTINDVEVNTSRGQEDKSLFYTGKQWDEDAQLYYFNARWYDPETGRFITEDPIRDGLLWYAYCGNNPMGYRDHTGLEYDGEDYSDYYSRQETIDRPSTPGEISTYNEEQISNFKNGFWSNISNWWENQKEIGNVYEDIVNKRKEIFGLNPEDEDSEMTLQSLVEQLAELLSLYDELGGIRDDMIKSNVVFFAPEDFTGIQYKAYNMNTMFLYGLTGEFGYVTEFKNGKITQATPYMSLNGGFNTNAGLDVSVVFGTIENAEMSNFLGLGTSIGPGGGFIVGYTGAITAMDDPDSFGVTGIEKPPSWAPNSFGSTWSPVDLGIYAGYTWACQDLFFDYN